jgi:hypothetical protein
MQHTEGVKEQYYIELVEYNGRQLITDSVESSWCSFTKLAAPSWDTHTVSYIIVVLDSLFADAMYCTFICTAALYSIT